MRRFVWIILVVTLIASIAGCSRATRLANDIDWIVFDGEPSREN